MNVDLDNGIFSRLLHGLLVGASGRIGDLASLQPVTWKRTSEEKAREWQKCSAQHSGPARDRTERKIGYGCEEVTGRKARCRLVRGSQHCSEPDLKRDLTRKIASEDGVNDIRKGEWSDRCGCLQQQT